MDSDSPDPVSRGLAACAARGGGGTPSISNNSNDLGGNVVGENSSRVSPTEVLVDMSNDRPREDEQAVGDLIDLTTVLDQSSIISSSLEVRTGSMFDSPIDFEPDEDIGTPILSPTLLSIGSNSSVTSDKSDQSSHPVGKRAASSPEMEGHQAKVSKVQHDSLRMLAATNRAYSYHNREEAAAAGMEDLYEAGRQQVIAKFGIDIDRDPVYFLAPEKAAEVLEIVYRPVYDQKAIDDARGGIAPSSRGSSVDSNDMEVAAIFDKTRATVEEDKRRQETLALLRGYVLRREFERASQTDPGAGEEPVGRRSSTTSQEEVPLIRTFTHPLLSTQGFSRWVSVWNPGPKQYYQVFGVWC